MENAKYIAKNNNNRHLCDWTKWTHIKIVYKRIRISNVSGKKWFSVLMTSSKRKMIISMMVIYDSRKKLYPLIRYIYSWKNYEGINFCKFLYISIYYFLCYFNRKNFSWLRIAMFRMTFFCLSKGFEWTLRKLLFECNL